MKVNHIKQLFVALFLLLSAGTGYRRPVEIGEDEPERRWQQGYAHLEGIR